MKTAEFNENFEIDRRARGVKALSKHTAVAALHTNRDNALADGQRFFNAEIERLRERIRKYEAERICTQPENLRSVVMSI